MSNTLRPLKKGTLKAQTFNTIQEAIFKGQFQPGDALREAHLGRELGVSQSTIREALVELEHNGLVVRVPNKGTTVTQFTQKEILERLSIRVQLEEMAWLEAAKRMKPEHFDVLDQHLEAIDKAIKRNQYFENGQADLDFHRYIWRQSGNATLYQMLDQLTVPLFAFISLKRRSSQEKLAEVVPPHGDIVAGLRDNDAKAIRAALHDHLEVFRSVPESAL